jgi:hypothetical protein
MTSNKGSSREVNRNTNISKDDSILSGGYFDAGLDVDKVMWSNSARHWLFNKLKIT